MKPSMFISPYDAMWREIGCLYRALEQAREDLERAVEGMSPAALQASDASGPSIASLLLGCGAEEASWIHRRWRKAEPPRAPTASAGKDAIVAWLREVREASRLALIKATDQDLDRRTIASDDGLASLRWVLFHLLDGAAFARGQITMLRTGRK
jgi:uncharacterized damage-inducible protein DinB